MPPSESDGAHKTVPPAFSDGDRTTWPIGPKHFVLRGPDTPASNWKRRLRIDAFPDGYELFTSLGKDGRKDNHLFGHPNGMK